MHHSGCFIPILDRKRARAKENPHLADEVEVEENPF